MAPFGEHPLNMFSYRIISYDNIYKQVFNESFVFNKRSYTHEGHKFYYMSGDMRFPTMVCAASKGSDQPARTCRLIRAFASRY